jgi:hypothetical protein
MKLIFLFIFYSTCLFGQNNLFDFPIEIRKINLSDISTEINKNINEYYVDSIKLNTNQATYFRFLVCQNKHQEYYKYWSEDRKKVGVSIDFEGYNYIKVNNEYFLVLNPYLGMFFYENIEVSENFPEMSAVFICHKSIFEFSNNGDVLKFPNDYNNRNNIEDFLKLIIR